jgi:hypothetical protein
MLMNKTGQLAPALHQSMMKHHLLKASPPLPSRPSSPRSSLPPFPSRRLPTAWVVGKVPIFEHVNAGVFKGSHLRERITRHEFGSFSCIQNTNLDNIANEETGASMIMFHEEAHGICFLCGRLDSPTPCYFNGLVHVGMMESHHFSFYQERICNQIGKTISSV